MSDSELEIREKLNYWKAVAERQNQELKMAFRIIDELRLKNQEAMECIEIVATGERLYCEICKKYHPCNCDQG